VVKKMEALQSTRQHSGRASLDSTGAAVVELPLSFSGGELTYQVTPIGKPMPNLHIADEKQEEQTCNFKLSGGVPNKSVSYTVTMVLAQQNLFQEKPKQPPSCCNTDGAQEPVLGCLNSSSQVPEAGRTGTPRGGAGKKIR